LNPLIEDSCRKGRRWPGMPAHYSQELLVESNFQQEPRAQYILDHASPWLNGKVEEPSFIWWSQNLNPLIEDSCRKGRRWPGMPAHYSQELLVESNFQQEPRAQYVLDHASPWLNGKVEEPSFIWWSQNLNPLIEDSCRKGRRWPGMPAYYSQELLVESNFQQEPRAQYILDHASP